MKVTRALMMSAGVRGVRLATLLRSFGLCPRELSQQEPKLALACLKAAYRDKAKEEHPDRAPDEEKSAAQERFVRLNNEFAEALKLIEAGVVPVSGWSAPDAYDAAGGHRAAHPAWQHPGFQPGHPMNARVFKHSEPPQFDTYTRVKGHLILWSSLFVFFTILREFLVGTAGGTWAWRAPNTLNPFYIRRFEDEWMEDAQAKRRADEEAKRNREEKLAKEGMKPEKVERGVPSFYQKRGISNVRRKYEPRGLGPSLG
eukprot:TRINITY_DN78594_c0_g1_i1.p1 TRINITY_DN78594_c0_g1~~TRINITY_DN78594_c0_g1_i1.p1  ORF type:complete len:257 (+),score=49.58 TRINITY_DN78594_c0_g1_i1:102-872(+)